MTLSPLLEMLPLIRQFGSADPPRVGQQAGGRVTQLDLPTRVDWEQTRHGGRAGGRYALQRRNRRSKTDEGETLSHQHLTKIHPRLCRRPQPGRIGPCRSACTLRHGLPPVQTCAGSQPDRTTTCSRQPPRSSVFAPVRLYRECGWFARPVAARHHQPPSPGLRVDGHQLTNSLPDSSTGWLSQQQPEQPW